MSCGLGSKVRLNTKSNNSTEVPSQPPFTTTMGVSSSTPTLSPEQQDVMMLGERCPFGDAELRKLYRHYQAMVQPDSAVTPLSFLRDWGRLAGNCGWTIDETLSQQLYHAAFCLPGDSHALPTQREHVTALTDEYTQRARLENFFEGLSNCSRRGAKAALTVLFECCSGPKKTTVEALELIVLGYRLACTSSSQEETREQEEDITLRSDESIKGLSQSLLEQHNSRLRRSGYPVSESNTQVTFEEVLEWSEAVAPLFAFVLPTLFHRLLFAGQRSSQSQYIFPSIATDSAFLESPTRLFALGSLSKSLGGTYTRLYSSNHDGLSFNRLLHTVLGYAGPTLFLIRSGTTVLGAFTATAWKESAAFYGTSDCFLFTLSPRTAVYRPTGNGTNYMYCNSHARSKGYDQQAHGLGFGGTTDQPRLFLSEKSLEEESRVGSRDLCFGHGQLFDGNDFYLDALEVWGVGGTELVENALAGRKEARSRKDAALQKARKVDKAAFLGDLQSGLIQSKAFAHRNQVDGRAHQEETDK